MTTADTAEISQTKSNTQQSVTRKHKNKKINKPTINAPDRKKALKINEDRNWAQIDIATENQESLTQSSVSVAFVEIHSQHLKGRNSVAEEWKALHASVENLG